MMIGRLCNEQTNEYDLQAKTYRTICTHHKLSNNNEKKIPGFPKYINAINGSFGCNKHLKRTTAEKYGSND